MIFTYSECIDKYGDGQGWCGYEKLIGQSKLSAKPEVLIYGLKPVECITVS